MFWPLFASEPPYKAPPFLGWATLRAELQSWVRTPYKWLQRTKQRGTDCTSFITQSLLNVGYLTRLNWPIYYRPDWYTDPEDNQLYDVLKENFDQFAREGIVFRFFEIDDRWFNYIRGDILLFKIRRNVQVYNHSSILGDGSQMYHISTTSAVHLVDFDDRWKGKCKGVFRIYFKD
jgi:cell wall-associated NlpC family hydrolase